jgi:hypothetical protein
MSKLAAAIRNHFVIVPYVEAKASSYRSPRDILALSIDLLLGATPAISVAINSPTTCCRAFCRGLAANRR